MLNCLAASPWSSSPPRSPACTCGATARWRSRGFSFTEILFAVIILGIGFIMIAGIFPVAIQQGKLTTEEGTAAGVAREALGYLGQAGANSDSIPNYLGGPLFPATGVTGSSAPYLGLVYSVRDPQPQGVTNLLNTPQQPATNTPPLSTLGTTTDNLWNRLKLSLIVPSDQRYAFVGLYRRNGDPNDRRTWSPFVQTWFIPVTARSRSIYDPNVDPNPTGTVPNQINPNLQARLVKVSIDIDPVSTYSTAANNHYVLYNWSGMGVPSNYQPTSLFENCYIIIANDRINFPVVNTVNVNLGRMNGHIYHVGLRRPDLDATIPSGSTVTAYDLAANGDFTPDIGADGFYGTNTATSVIDDIFTIGMMQPGIAPTLGTPFSGSSSEGNASGPADAYVVGLDDSGADPGTSQDISAFTTFIKVN